MKNRKFIFRLLFLSLVALVTVWLAIFFSFYRGRATSGPVYNLPPDLCNPTSDSTVQIQNYLATISGGTVLFPAGKTCLIAQTILLPGNLTYDLNGATLYRQEEPEYDKARPLVKFDSVSDATITNGTIKGALIRGEVPKYDPKRPKYHGIQTSGAKNITISNLTIKDIHGDCVDVDGNKTIGPSTNITIQNVSCSGSGRQGISTGHVDGVLLDTIDFDFIARSAVDLEPTPGKNSLNVTIQNSTFRWIGNFAFAMAGGSPNLTNIVVQNNTQLGCEAQIQQNNCFAPFTYIGNKYMRGPITIKNNQVKGKIRVLHMSGEVTGNVLTANPFNEECFVLSLDSANLSVHGNVPLPGVKEVCIFTAADFPGATGIPTPTVAIQPTLPSAVTPTPVIVIDNFGDLVGPSLTVLSPQSNAQLKGNVALNAIAKDNTGVSSVSFFLDGKLIGTGQKSGENYSFKWNSSSTVNGSHILRVTAYDLSKNSVTVNVNVTVAN